MSHNNLLCDWRRTWLMGCQMKVRAECRVRNDLVPTDRVSFSLEDLKGTSIP